MRPEFAQERLRRQRLPEDLGRARNALQAKSVPIAAGSGGFDRHVDELPGVESRPGEVRIALKRCGATPRAAPRAGRDDSGGILRDFRSAASAAGS